MKNQYCSNCGKELEVNSNFCTHCGHKINKPIEDKDSKSSVEKQNEYDHKKKFEIASAGKRFVNYIVDYFVINVLFFIVLVVCMVVISIFNSNYVESAIFSLFIYLLYFSTFFLYYFILEITTGKTFGKLLTGTRTIDEEGNIPSPSSITKRTLCRLIPFEAFSYLTSKPYGWHDSIPKVRVVQKVK